MNKRGQKAGAQRGDRRRFPYEPRLIGGKLYMPAELQSIHQAVLGAPVLGSGRRRDASRGGSPLA